MTNSIICAVIGRVGTDPELRQSQTGKPWARFDVAVEAGDVVQWVQLAAFGESAEEIASGLKKGDRCYIEGSLRLNEWTVWLAYDASEMAPRAPVWRVSAPCGP